MKLRLRMSVRLSVRTEVECKTERGLRLSVMMNVRPMLRLRMRKWDRPKSRVSASLRLGVEAEAVCMRG